MVHGSSLVPLFLTGTAPMCDDFFPLVVPVQPPKPQPLPGVGWRHCAKGCPRPPSFNAECRWQLWAALAILPRHLPTRRHLAALPCKSCVTTSGRASEEVETKTDHHPFWETSIEAYCRLFPIRELAIQVMRPAKHPALYSFNPSRTMHLMLTVSILVGTEIGRTVVHQGLWGQLRIAFLMMGTDVVSGGW